MTTRPRVPSFKPPATRFLEAAPPEPGAAAEQAAAVLFGAPLDLTESFRAGAHAGPAAVRFMSDALESYSPELDRDLCDLTLLDAGDLDLDGQTMDEALENIAEALAWACTAGRVAVLVGGEHTASLGGYRGVKRVYPQAALVQIDAHLDMRPSYQGEALTHASWLYHAGQEFGFRDIVQLGLRSGERAEWRWARAQTALTSPDLRLPDQLRRQLEGRPIYVSVDIDVLDPSVAPGTGCPEPGGVTFRELAACLYQTRGLQVVAVDVMEVAPHLEASNITAAAAAKIIREMVLLHGNAGADRMGVSAQWPAAGGS